MSASITRRVAAGRGVREPVQIPARPARTCRTGRPASHSISAATFGQLPPVGVDFLLGVAVHVQRHGVAHLEVLAAVERNELLPVELEGDDHDAARRTRHVLLVVHDFLDPRVGKDRDVEFRGLLGLVDVGQERGDLRHDALLVVSRPPPHEPDTSGRPRKRPAEDPAGRLSERTCPGQVERYRDT
jgi:hypothetical protein